MQWSLRARQFRFFTWDDSSGRTYMSFELIAGEALNICKVCLLVDPLPHLFLELVQPTSQASRSPSTYQAMQLMCHEHLCRIAGPIRKR